jgi:glutaredoxin
MTEEAGRILLVGAVAVLALISAALASRLRAGRVERSVLRLDELPDRVIVFTSDACAACTRIRAVLEKSGVSFREVRYEVEPELHRRVGVAAVPLLVIRDQSGRVAARIAGVPARRRLRRALLSGDVPFE